MTLLTDLKRLSHKNDLVKIAALLEKHKDSPFDKAISWACEKGYSTMIGAFLTQSPHTLESEPQAWIEGFLQAVEMKHLDIVKTLLSHGMNPNAQTQHKGPAIVLAVQNQDITMVSELLAYHPDLNCADHDGQTALIAACQNADCSTIVELLCTYRAQVNAPNTITGQTPLMQACQVNAADTVQTLIAYGAQPNHQEFQNMMTPLMYAVQYASLEVVRALLNAGAITDAKNHEGNTALCLAAIKGKTPYVHMLIEYGAQLNHANNNGYTPVMLAIEKCRIETIQYLVSAGANLYSANKKGLHAFAMAQSVEDEAAREAIMTILLPRAQSSFQRFLNQTFSKLLSVFR
ncbi:MAG: hypothetical protein FJ161_00165 [Gammaproteobacteria bacterium]|nr:hypothetical protein [Gammaproteobacteria bacterium]